jgi:antitoxin (DNA-binding transcriptional repressor) of toxin-antitoxin stability system
MQGWEAMPELTLRPECNFSYIILWQASMLAYREEGNMHQITIQEAESHISSVFSNVLSGEEIVLTDHDMPVMKMTPITRPNVTKRPMFGSLKGKIWISDDFNDTPEEFADYM